MRHLIENDTLTVYLEGKITSANAADLSDAMAALVAETKPARVVLDASALEHIASAGLRAIMRLAKSVREVVIVEASREVYNVFDVTGFTQVLDVRGTRRHVSVEGCPIIGRGAEGTVYRLNPETIVKVYSKGMDEVVLGEKRRAQAAFLEGIPTAISYDVVDVDGCAGVVYELLDAQNLSELVETEPERRDALIAQFARLLRECHKVELDPNKFDDNKQLTLNALKHLEGALCTAEETRKILAVVENAPDSRRFCHGDAHVGNVMVQGSEMLFIDMAHVGMGHPVFDLMSMFLRFKLQAERRLAKGALTLEEQHHVWDVFLSTYLDTDDEALLAKAEGQVAAFSCARLLTAALFLPGVVPPEEVKGLMTAIIDAYDKGLEPLCF